jgi:hypothetical protein
MTLREALIDWLKDINQIPDNTSQYGGGLTCHWSTTHLARTVDALYDGGLTQFISDSPDIN